MSPQAGFVLVNQIVPRLRAAVSSAVRLVGSEDAEEILQDATAIAAKLIHSAEEAQKQVTPGNIAYYTVQIIKSGRRSTGPTATDVMQPGTQLQGRSHLVSLDEPLAEAAENEVFMLHDVLASEHQDPAVLATRKLIGKRSSKLNRRGTGPSSAARQLGRRSPKWPRPTGSAGQRSRTTRKRWRQR